MNRPRHPLIVILVTLGAAALVIIRHFLGLGCPIAEALGIPCPTCGMTRAAIAALRLDFKSAFSHHPLFFTLPLIYWTVVTEFSPFKNKRVNKLILVALASAFIAVWVVKLAVHFA